MNLQLVIITLASALILSLTACKDHHSEPNIKLETASAVAVQNIATDQWIGQWNGPEGTSLKITGGNGKYEIIIQNLDGPQNYTGISIDNGIQFERNGIMEKIEATNGAETGMKWLSEKSNCLTIHKGEGFCRD
jgi:hypothetical protein